MRTIFRKRQEYYAKVREEASKAKEEVVEVEATPDEVVTEETPVEEVFEAKGLVEEKPAAKKGRKKAE